MGLSSAVASGATSGPTSTQTATTQSQPARAPSFAQIVPDDVRAYAEIYGLSHIEDILSPSGGWAEWTRLAAGQTSQPAVTVEWTERVTRILGMSLADAAKTLFSQQIAIAAPSHDELAEGVVLARAPDQQTIAALLQANKAQPQPGIGPVKCFMLKEGLSLAVHDLLVVLGNRSGKAKLFDRVVSLAAGQAGVTLAASPGYAALAKQLSAGNQGVLYVDMPAPAPQTAPAGNPNPKTDDASKSAQSPWTSFRRLVVGIFPQDGGLDLEVRGLLDRPYVRGGLKDVSLDPIAKLPQSTLLVYAETMDLSAMYRQVMGDRSPRQSAIRFNLEVVKALLHPIDLEKEFLGKLGPQVMLICGHAPADQRQTDGSYDLPLVAIMVESSDIEASTEVLNRFAERFLGWMNVQLARAKRTLELSINEVTYRGTTIHRVALEGLFSRTTNCPFLKTVEFCWAGVGHWLIVATHVDHIRQIIDARQGPEAKTFAASPSFKSVGGRKGITSIVLARPADAARMLQTWIDYLEKKAPHVFKPLWWQRMMVRRGGRRVALGIIIKEGAEPGRVVVGNPVLPEMPAAGRLQPGDKICAVDGRNLSEDHPEEDLRDFVAMREGPAVVLRVEREGKLLDVRIPMSPPPPLPVTADIDPIRAIRYLISLCRNASVGGYVRTNAEPHQLSATLVLRLNRTPHGK
ncbi:MAG: PDZ domain-containing protein [Phycisphaerae bacterium]|nr:PDZ domain-containing protein [Phycisphaerae bacterium]